MYHYHRKLRIESRETDNLRLFERTKEANKLKKLTDLNLYCGHDLDDESFINLVTGCNQLKYIDIDGCHTITYTSLYSIADNCPNLRTICLPMRYNYEADITVEGLLALVNKCPKLTEIEAGDLPKVIKQELNKRLTY